MKRFSLRATILALALLLPVTAWAPPPGAVVVREGANIGPANIKYGLIIGALTAANAPFRVGTNGIIYMENGASLFDSGGTAGYANSGGNWTSFAAGTGDFKADGSVPMTGDLNMGAQALTNVGNVDGVDVSAHATSSSVHHTATVDTDTTYNAGTNMDLVGTQFSLSVTEALQMDGNDLAEAGTYGGNAYMGTYYGNDTILKGPFEDARAYASFASAITSIGATQTTLLIPTAQTVSTNETVPTTMELMFTRSGSLSIDTGKTVTINGPQNAGLHQIYAGSGSVSFGAGSVTEVYPEWWGVDGTADEVQFEAAITAITDASYKAVAKVIATGSYTISSTINITEVQGLIFDGISMWGTNFSWAGDTSSSMFLLDDTRDGSYSNFTINGSSAYPLKTAIESINGTGVNVVSTKNTFSMLWIDGGGSKKIEVGIRYSTNSGGTDANNDLGHFDRVFIHQYSDSAWRFEHSQSKAHKFYDSTFSGSNTATYGVYSEGSFVWFGGSGGGTDTDFHLEAANDSILISGFNGENSTRFLTTAGPSGSPFAITVLSVRWQSSRAATDDNIIKYQFAGPLNLIGNSFQAQDDPLVYLNRPADPLNFTSIGNYWVGDTATTSPYNLNAGSNPNIHIRGDSYVVAGDPPTDMTTFTDGDATPAVYASNYFDTATTAVTITGFDDAWGGKEFAVVSQGPITYDFTASNLEGSLTDLTTASGDVTGWICTDTTKCSITSYTDAGADITTVAVPDGGTGANTLTDGGVLLGSGTGAVTPMAVLADSAMIVGDGTTDPVAESGATLRTSIGVGTGDSPQFTGVEVGAATDTTLTRASAGDLAVEGNAIYRAGGTDVALADGGTGAGTAAAARANLEASSPIDSVVIAGSSLTVKTYRMGKANEAYTITDIHCITDTGTVIIELMEQDATGAAGATVDAPITCDSNGAEDDGTLSNGTIDAADWLAARIGTEASSPTDVTITWYGTID